jgi:hypothetical protein
MKGIRRCDSILPSIAQSLDFLISSIAHSLDHLASPAPLHKVWGFFGGGGWGLSNTGGVWGETGGIPP